VYTVNVFNAVTKECIHSRTFAFGTFAEIGLWLDYVGYIDDGYYVKIYFSGREV
jgi:hypothetical protein